MATISVSNTAGLLNALKTAKGGDVVALQGGTYTNVNLLNINISGGVTITSANSGKPAVIADLLIRDSSQLSLTGLEFSVNPNGALQSFRVEGAKNIKFDRIDMHGTMNGSSADDKDGLIIRESSFVSVTNSKFEQLRNGLTHLNSTDVTISGNRMEYIRDDGIRGGGTSRLLIDNNYFTNFDHPDDTEFHSDAIQTWTTNTTKVATDITITNNTIVRGNGWHMQGIWMRDEVGNLPMERVTISGNTLIGTNYEGIGLRGVGSAVVSNNTVIAQNGQPSWIDVTQVRQATVTNNVADEYVYRSSGITSSGNVKATTVGTAQAATLTAWASQNAGLGGLASKLAARIYQSVGMFGPIDAVPPVSKTPAATAGASAAPVLTFVETTIKGAAGNDILRAGAIGDHRLEGGAGDDQLFGNAGFKTTMVGGAGNDTYTVKTAKDIVVESANGGTDTVCNHINYTLGANVENARVQVAGLTTIGNELNNSLVGTAGKDILYGMAGDDALQGLGGDDILYGGAGNDVLKGDDGNDILWAGTGDDTLYGGAGDDILYAESGTNRLEGGPGRDKLYGGTGQDSFVFRPGDFVGGLDASMDTIYNFSAVQKDKIALNALDANTNTAANDAFAFIGTGGFTKVAGQLRYEVSGRDAFVLGDTNGDGVADFKIHVVGVTSFTAGDFYL